MVKFRFKQPSGRIGVGVCLSQENWVRLLEGQPLMFSGEQLDIAGFDFLVMGVNTEADLARVAETLVGKHGA